MNTRDRPYPGRSRAHVLWDFGGNLRVDSLTNFQFSHADGDELIVDNLVRNPAFLEQSMGDMRSVVPLMYLVLLPTMTILLRSFSLLRSQRPRRFFTSLGRAKQPR